MSSKVKNKNYHLKVNIDEISNSISFEFIISSIIIPYSKFKPSNLNRLKISKDNYHIKNLKKEISK